MRLVLFLILWGCNQHSASLVDGREAGGKTPSLDCNTPSPLCPDLDAEQTDKDTDNEEETEQEREAEQPPGTAQGSGAQPVSEPMIDYFAGNSNQFKLNVHPTTIPKDQETELTMTVTAILNMRLKPKDNYGRYRTYDLWLAAQKTTSTSARPSIYKLTQASPLNFFPQNKQPQCDISKTLASYTKCTLPIIQMDKDDSFTIKLQVKASESFNIGTAKDRTKKPLTIEIQ